MSDEKNEEGPVAREAGLPDLSYDMLSPDEMRRHVRARTQGRCQHEYKSSPKLGGAVCEKCGKIEPPPAPVAQQQKGEHQAMTYTDYDPGFCKFCGTYTSIFSVQCRTCLRYL